MIKEAYMRGYKYAAYLHGVDGMVGDEVLHPPQKDMPERPENTDNREDDTLIPEAPKYQEMSARSGDNRGTF